MVVTANRTMIYLIFKLLQQDRLELKRLVTARYPLAQINRAIEDMRNGSTAGRVMIDL